MATAPSETLQKHIDMAKADVESAAKSLDKLIVDQAPIPYELRLLLINLLTATSKQNLVIDLMAMELDHLTRLHNIVMNHLRTPTE